MPPAFDPQPGRLQVSVFGGPALRDGSAEISLSQYQAALLGLVYGHGRPGVSRSRLIWLLWEEDDTTSSRHRLSQLLYAVTRKAPQQELFVVQGELISGHEQVCSDLLLFEDFLNRKHVGAACELLQRGLLPSLSAPTRELEDWTAARVIALRSRLRSAAASLWSEAEGAGTWSAARDAAEALFALDPDSESYLRCVMKARALCGAFEEAEAAYRNWAELVPPSVSARAADVLDALETWREHSTTSKVTAADPAFVGRSEEIAALRRALKMKVPDNIRVVVVTGEPGIGKTRLVEEVCRDAIADGARVIRCSCSPLEQEIPLNPLLDILRDSRFDDAVSMLPEPWRSVVQDLLPETGRDRVEVPYVEPSALSRRLYETVRRLLSEIARESVVLWVDDFQWVDHTTAAALEFALRRWDKGQLTLLLSARKSDEGGGTAGLRLISSVGARSTTIHLEELSRAHAMSLATSILGASFPPKEQALLLGLTGNVPLYIVEVAHEFVEGRMHLDGSSDSAGPVPVRIQEVVNERLSLLAPVQRWVLEVIAVGTRLSTDVIGATIKEPEGVLLDSLDRLMALRLITAEKSTISCKHDLIRQGIYASMTPIKRTALHRRIAESLLALAVDQDASQLALHFDRAEMPEEAFRFAKAAADRAEETGAAHEAIRFLRIAKRTAPNALEATRLIAREADVRWRQAEFDQAVRLLTIAEIGFREHGDDAAMACGIRRTLGARETGILEHDQALAAVDQLLQDCETAQLWGDYIEGLEARLVIVEMANNVPELSLTLERLRRIPDISDSRVQCLANFVRALNILFGDGAGALAAAERAYQIAKESSFKELEARALHRLFLVHTFGGTLHSEDGGWILEEGLRLAATSDSVRRRYRLLEAAGLWSMESGDLALAERYFGQAEDFLRSTSESIDHLNVCGNLGELHITLGQFERAHEYFARAQAALRPHDNWRLHQIVYGGLGYCALELGNLQLVRECEAKINHTTESYFDPWMIVLFKSTLLRRRGKHDDAIEYLERLASRFDNRLRLVAIKLRLLECRFCAETSRNRSQEIARWLLKETQRLRLPKRFAEAEALASSARS